jgi:hypothetical protein
VRTWRSIDGKQPRLPVFYRYGSFFGGYGMLLGAFELFPGQSETKLRRAAGVQQSDIEENSASFAGRPLYHSELNNQVNANDTLYLSSGFSITGNSDSKSSQTYTWKDSRGACYSRTIASQAQALASVRSGQGCSARFPF